MYLCTAYFVFINIPVLHLHLSVVHLGSIKSILIESYFKSEASDRARWVYILTQCLVRECFVYIFILFYTCVCIPSLCFSSQNMLFCDNGNVQKPKYGLTLHELEL